MDKVDKVISSIMEGVYTPTTIQSLIDDFKQSEQDPEDFIFGVGDMELQEAIPQVYSHFFEDPTEYRGVVYHQTTTENLPSILTNGLIPSNKTRGLTNQSTGSATFASIYIDEMGSYGDITLEIDLDIARDINTRIKTELEWPIADSLRRKELANILDVEDVGQFEPDSSDGLQESTLVIYGHIPKESITQIE